MYKSASKNAQGRVSRILPKDMPSDAFISAREESETLNKLLTNIDKQIVSLPYGEERKSLGLKKSEMAKRQSELRKQISGYIEFQKGISIHEHIIQVTKEIIPKWQWEFITKEANKRHKEFIDNNKT